MKPNSSHISAWNYQEPIIPLSHRHQLQSLQELIQKSKNKTQRKHIKIAPAYQDLTKIKFMVRQSFMHVNKNKRLKTEQPSKNISKLIKQKSLPFEKMENDQISKLKIANNSSIFWNNVISPITKSSIKQQIPSFALQKVHNHNLTSKSKSQLITYFGNTKKLKHRLSSLEINTRKYGLKMNKDKSKKLQNGFLQAIQAKLDEENPHHRVKQHEIRCKNMIYKSNFRKKQLQSLFKTRVLVSKKQQDNAIIENRIEELFASELDNKQSIYRAKTPFWKMKDEFTDELLYCPWRYNQNKLINHMRSKSNQ